VKTLTRYIGREVFASIMLIFSALVMLFAFFDLIHELGDVGRGGYTITAALLFVALQLPARMYELFPVATLIGTLFGLAQLVSTSEYTVMRASGASLLQVRFWFKQDYTFVNIRSVLADLTLVGVRIYEFDNNLHLKLVRNAESGTFVGNGQWRLKGVKTTEFSPAETHVSQAEDYAWDTVLRPSLLNVYQVAPEKLELNALWENMRVLGTGAQKTARFEIAFWNKVFYPVSVVVMMIVALPFSYFQRRQGGVGFRMFAGTILGLTFFLIGRLFSNLGVLNDWPPLFSATFPLVVFVLLTMALLWWLERR